MQFCHNVFVQKCLENLFSFIDAILNTCAETILKMSRADACIKHRRFIG